MAPNRLTNAYVISLRCGTKPVDVSDPGIPGLVMRLCWGSFRRYVPLPCALRGTRTLGNSPSHHRYLATKAQALLAIKRRNGRLRVALGCAKTNWALIECYEKSSTSNRADVTLIDADTQQMS